MLFGEFWNQRLENWARVYGPRRRAGTSSTWALMRQAPQRDQDDEAEARQWVPPDDATDADIVDALLLHDAVDPVARLYIVSVYARRMTLTSFGRPRRDVVRVMRAGVATMERIERGWIDARRAGW